MHEITGALIDRRIMESPLEPRSENRFPNRGTTYTGASLLESAAHVSDLRESIENLYAAFADATLSAPLRGCPHCFTPADLEYVRVTPLRSLSHGDLYIIQWKIVSTLGNESDVAYFLPRLMEALAEGALFDLDVLAQKIERIPASDRTERRIAGIREMLHAITVASDGTDTSFAADPGREDLTRVIEALVP